MGLSCILDIGDAVCETLNSTSFVNIVYRLAVLGNPILGSREAGGSWGPWNHSRANGVITASRGCNRGYVRGANVVVVGP
jgi:hypothetical protein